MGNDNHSPISNKPHFDINLSKRTRKPINFPKEAEKETPPNNEEKEEETDDHKSLKELIKERGPLGQHFTEEKKLQLVVKHHEEANLDGVKFKTLVGRYAKVLSRLIKNKRESHIGSRRKPALKLAK